jgi:two-component system response regulator YesN
MKEQLFISLMEGRLSRKRLKELMDFYGINLEAAYYMASIVRMGGVSGKANAEEDYLGGSGLITLSLKQIVDENLEHSFDFISCLYLDSIVVIALLNDQKQVKNFIHTMDQVCKSTNRILERSTCAGIGYLCGDLIEISHSYQGAKNAIDYHILFEPNQAIYIQDVEQQESTGNVWDSRYTESILREMKLGEEKDLVKAIQELIANIRNSNISFRLYQISLMEMMTEIFKLGRNYQLDMDRILGSDFSINTKIYQLASLEALREWLTDICLKIRGSIRRERTDSAKMLINKALDYLRVHYSDSELSVDILCNDLNVSATYFSVLFKRETGMSFVNYLTKVRMESALQLLNKTDEKSYNISTMVGYTEPNYFSYVFKKYYGVSPSNYRKIV